MNNEKNNLVELKSKAGLVGIKETNKVVITLIALTGTLAFSILGNLMLLNNNNQLATREKIFVQQQDGTTQEAVERDSNFRSDEVIKETVTNWLYLTWEWDSRIPGSEENDGGIEIKVGAEKYLVPTRVYTASYLIEEGFRHEFLKAMSELIPKEVYAGRLTSTLTIYHIGNPVKNKNGEYEVEVIATRTDVSETGSGEKAQAKFNKILILKPIEPYKNLLGEDEPSAFRQHLSQLLQNGLIITSIHNKN